jgi:DNA-binding transcriptional regulator YiaG
MKSQRPSRDEPPRDEPLGPSRDAKVVRNFRTGHRPAATFRKALSVLGMKQVEFAKLLQLGERTVRRYTEEGVSDPRTLILLSLLLSEKITPDDIRHAKRRGSDRRLEQRLTFA